MRLPNKSFFFDQTGRFVGQRPRSYETSLPNFDGLAKRLDFVMPDLIRHPEYAEISGFPDAFCG
jgi:hypothetical protein